MEDKDKRTGWLRKLNVGDKVILSSRYKKAISTIDKITPTGRIITRNTTYDSNGRTIGSDTWNRTYICEWTQEGEDTLKKEIDFHNMCRYITDKQWDKCDFDLIKAVYELIKPNV